MNPVRPSLFHILLAWLPLAVAVTVLTGLVNLAVQQNYRQSANDPQIQMAEDAATMLAAGASPVAVIPTASVDIGTSLAPFLAIYDDTGKPIAASGLLSGSLPELPNGIFAYTRTAGEERVTWQPESSVREALIVVHYGGAHPGFVAAGRSLREVEKRVDALNLITVLAWGTAMFLTLVFVGLKAAFRSPQA